MHVSTVSIAVVIVHGGSCMLLSIVVKGIAANKEAIEKLQEAEKAADETRDDLAKKVADNHKQVQANWETIKLYRAQLDLKADKVDMTSKVEKADVLGFIADRQGEWEAKADAEILQKVSDRLEELEKEVGRVVKNLGRKFSERAWEAKCAADEQAEKLARTMRHTAEATQQLASVGDQLQQGFVRALPLLSTMLLDFIQLAFTTRSRYLAVGSS